MTLSASCSRLAQACDEAGQWVARNGSGLRSEQAGLGRDLRKAARAFRGLARAAERRMCAGVFGPSQAGKSYLISALATAQGRPLEAVFGSESRDFLSEINPEGGKESTGLVTRFTLEPPASLPEGFPVRVRLLSELDIVKILANSYFADTELDEAPQTDIAATLTDLAARARPEAEAGRQDGMEDLHEYLLANFRSKARTALLESEYWDEAIRLAPRLSLEDRATLYSLIFDGTPELAALLLRLMRALADLGNPEEAFLPLSALLPRERSIIDVETLRGLEVGADEDDGLDTVGASGRRVRLPRAVLAALTAELTITMRDKPAEYFEHTDLLDFPGYRSRYKFTSLRGELAKPGILQGLFLRGKVAYLFQRYCAERELTSMLLCIGPSNQEVQDLPGEISRWIDSTHGSSPEERAGRDPSLFFILTKFDMEFEIKSGARDVEKRWDNRLQASLLNFFGQSHEWPRQWAPGQPFNRLYLLRNPNFRFDAILEYDAAGREKGIRPDMAAYVGELEKAFLGSPLVRDHFRDPGSAWQAAMRLNDGGISRIRDELSPLCEPGLKQEQIRQAMRRAAAAVAQRLRPFYHSDDLEEERREKARDLKIFYDRLGQLEMKKQRLGELLRSLTIRDQDIYDLYPEAERKFYDLRLAEDEAPLPPAPETEEDLAELDFDGLNPFSPQNAPAETEDRPVGGPDMPSFFAAHVEAKWIEGLHRLAQDEAAQRYFMLDEKTFGALVSELSTGAARLGLGEAMAQAFRRAAAFASQKEKIIWQQASEAAHAINSFVAWLGYSPQEKSEEERTIKTGKQARPVFSPAPAPAGLPRLGPQAVPHTAEYFQDWLRALVALVSGNISYDGKASYDVDENLRLGAILRVFEENKG